MNKDQSNKFLFDPEKVNEALKSTKSMDDLFAEGGVLQLILKKAIKQALSIEYGFLRSILFQLYLKTS